MQLWCLVSRLLTRGLPKPYRALEKPFKVPGMSGRAGLRQAMGTAGVLVGASIAGLQAVRQKPLKNPLNPGAGLRQAMGTAGALVGASIAGLAYRLSARNP